MPSLIIDANNIAFSSFHRAKKSIISTAAITDLIIQKFNSIFREYLGHTFYVVWDGKNGSDWRRTIYQKYKRNRLKDANYPLYIEALNQSKDILSHYPIYQLWRDDSEADDLIYALTSKLSGKILIISSDQDMIQIAQKYQAIIINPTGPTIFPPFSWLRYKIIMGDRSDNIHAIKGLIPFVMEYLSDNPVIPAAFAGQYEINKRVMDFEEFPSLEENKSYIDETLRKTQNINLTEVWNLLSKYNLSRCLRSWKSIKNLIDQIA
jgi:hypothetical protein